MSDNFKLEPEKPSHEAAVEGKLGRLLEGITHSFPGLASVIQYFNVGFEEKRIRRDDVALYFQENKITFDQLDQLSSKLANILKEELGPNFTNENPDGDLVFGVCAPPSEQLVILLFAIMKLGGAYVPFDISFPEDRVIRIVSASKPVVVISDAHETTLSKFDPIKFKTKVITLDEIWAKAEALPNLKSTLIQPLEGNPNLSERTGIVLFTSGSSGEPKGVRLSHRTILNRLNWQWHQFPFKSNDSCCLKTALTFVDSVPEIFGPLLQGKHVVIFPKKYITNTHLFVQKVQDHKITRLTVVPSFLQSILTLMEIMDEKNSEITMFSTIKLWICSGEPLNHELLTQFFKFFPKGTTICNFYGSTEIMGDVTFEAFESAGDVDKKCIGGRGAHVPIGQALFNTVIYVLGPDLEMTPEGEIGEIYIAGYNLATGYVGVKESDKFITNPYTKTPGFSVLYRTGDFGHIHEMQTGRRALFYDGRTDSQIKVRGHRVDLSEIDEALNELTLVKKGVVLCYHAGESDQQIVAFVVPHDMKEGTADRISFVLESKLLPYQMPRVKILEEIPVLVNGKTDRQRLLWEYHEALSDQNEFDDWNNLGVPEDILPTYKVLIETVAKVTGTSVHDIVQDLDDSFYNLGGTSLNSLTVIAELKKQNYFISIHNFVTAKSIRELCQAIKYSESGKADYSLEQDVRKKLMPEMLNDSHKDEVIHIIATSFANKGDLETYVGVVYVDFVNLMNSIWRSLVDKGFSFVVRRRADMRITAACLNFDAYDEPTEFDVSPGLEIIFGLLEDCEAPVRKDLPEGKGKILHSFMMGTHEDLTEAENVFVTEFMEEETVRIGITKNFVGVFTTNTNTLTQQIARDIQGYTIMREVLFNQYQTPDGKRPFGLAPDSQKATVCWKEISK